MSLKLALQPEFIASDWRSGADAGAIEARLREDKGHTIKAVCVVHNETSTGATSRIDEVRRAIDAAKHPALFMLLGRIRPHDRNLRPGRDRERHVVEQHEAQTTGLRRPPCFTHDAGGVCRGLQHTDRDAEGLGAGPH